MTEGFQQCIIFEHPYF